ncbi:hypothetical protein CJ030_MR1G003360 [Morella rubra]|uniref:Uncharacterized protein n=1 Tax=Morella rubra TaxID=262757 RepID=A0A6A1WMP6_9ROSI|nr:hypothetical protein CJ030_MR1G003360 [Morella rubra]
MAPRRRASSSSQGTQTRVSLSLAQHQALIYKRPVVIERVVRLRDFNELEYEVLTVDANVEELTIQVKGVFFTLSANIIAQFIGILRPQVPAYSTIGPPFDMTSEEVWKEVTGADMIVPSTMICHCDMIGFFRMLDLIIVWDVAPKHHQILRDARYTSERDGLPHGLLISCMLVAAGVPILPDEKIRTPIGPICRSTFSRSATHLAQGGAHVAGDVDADEDAMDGRPPPRSLPTQRGRSSTYEVGQSSSSQVERPPWMNMLLEEIIVRMDKLFDKIKEEIRELRNERDT